MACEEGSAYDKLWPCSVGFGGDVSSGGIVRRISRPESTSVIGHPLTIVGKLELDIMDEGRMVGLLNADWFRVGWSKGGS